ncbi:efflux RND transporter periplasmic adaptor subunit [Pararhodonellum marinum]|uniref:efflux RND transporter periplasmic adaptor subunit n=1 Tax=Pararhodonellum marinum TaxID=2755358 RepID=UPI00188E0A78|nr:efflux RND transporter periplasmic adaptor subunit [Pararhodonellum marinum]
MKKIIILLLVISGVGFMAFRLYHNKVEMAENMASAMKTATSVPVTVEKAQMISLDRSFDSNGVFEAQQEITLMSETNGVIVRVFKKKGDYVKKGDLILQIDDRLIQSELTIAQLNHERFAKDLQRFTNLSESDAITKKQFEESERDLGISEAQLMAIRKRLDDTQVKAPISGYINEDFYETGVLVNPGMPLAHIINKYPMKLKVFLSENEIATANLGDVIPVNVNAIPNKKFEGTVNFISDKADGSFKYEVNLIMKGEDLEIIKPGMFGTAKFSSKSPYPSIVINRKSISGGLKDPGVFVINDDAAVYKPIKARPIDASLVEVMDGLSEGEEIIASGLINVKEGIKVKVQ